MRVSQVELGLIENDSHLINLSRYLSPAREKYVRHVGLSIGPLLAQVCLLPSALALSCVLSLKRIDAFSISPYINAKITTD